MVDNIFRKLCISCMFMLVPGLILHFELKETVTNAKASIGWPSVEGTVLTSRIKYRASPDHKGAYHPYIWYKYSVDGEKHGSNVIAFSASGSPAGGSKDKAKAQEFLKDYPIGKSIKVYYNPDNHKVATLYTGVDRTTTIVYYGLHTIFCIAAILAVFYLLMILISLTSFLSKNYKNTLFVAHH